MVKVYKVKKTMKCERCKTVVVEGEQKALHGQTLCEDCCIDLLSPLRVCDPWAVHSAKTFVKEEAAVLKLTPVQQKIIGILQNEGPQEPGNLCERLKIGGGPV
jgi:late competence protein required for DNA uptake (superfamily II DNA/RNA helicase)